ncbi:unnamed protein product [Schistosoma curassoni]|uniref:IST1 homolog n=1 Tax=Schistosoma mattheei TaxID=31246 RepID=A0AA85B2Z3_9TREM|nr:unnamed protein product [Schistosoma mattheei]CAH8631600.1 unnamed protein product [Schistosoma curassoni]
MFSSTCDYTKLRLNIRLCIQRLEYVQKKKSEISKGIRREIADLLKDGKVDRARIKVEQIIRDDYCVEAMDIIQSYLETLNARFGLIQDAKLPDASLETPIATILWSKSRIKNEIPELDIVGQQLAIKFGRNYVRECCEKANMVNRTVMTKLNSIVPGANLVEMYLVEIAKSYDVSFTPDTHVICDSNLMFNDNLIEFKPDSSVGLPSMPSNFGACSMPWATTSMSDKAPYPTEFINETKIPSGIPSNETMPSNTTTTNGDTVMPPPYDMSVCNGQNTVVPFNYPGPSFLPPQDSFTTLPPGSFAMIPPMNGPSNPPPDDEKADFDTLAERFEKLKKK